MRFAAGRGSLRRGPALATVRKSGGDAHAACGWGGETSARRTPTCLASRMEWRSPGRQGWKARAPGILAWHPWRSPIHAAFGWVTSGVFRAGRHRSQRTTQRFPPPSRGRARVGCGIRFPGFVPRDCRHPVLKTGCDPGAPAPSRTDSPDRLRPGTDPPTRSMSPPVRRACGRRSACALRCGCWSPKRN